MHNTPNSKKGVRSLIVAGYIGLGGTAALARNFRDKIDARFPLYLSREAAAEGDPEKLLKEEALALEIIERSAGGKEAFLPESETERAFLVKAGEGGFLTAMYNLAEESRMGFETDIRLVPIKQETIEICELLEVNPYHLYCGGCLIMIIRDGDILVSELEKEGIHAVVIGHTNDKKSHILMNDGTESHLNRPEPDELERLGIKI